MLLQEQQRKSTTQTILRSAEKITILTVPRHEQTGLSTSTVAQHFADRLEIPALRQQATALINSGMELRHISAIIGSNPSRLDVYRDAIKTIVEDAKAAIVKLVEALDAAGMFQFIEIAARSLDRKAVDLQQMPSAEEALLNDFGLSAAERMAVIDRLFEAARRDQADFLRSVLDRSMQKIARYEEQFSSAAALPKARILDWLFPVSKVLFGLGIIGINVLGFAATSGLALSLEATLLSAFEGAGLAVDGAEDLDAKSNSAHALA